MSKINNYDWLEFSIPKGWMELGRKMIEECEAINPTYTIEDMKEKYGSLRIYSFIQDYNDPEWQIPACNDEEIQKIENKYERLSSRICCECGKPATKYSTGWICPFCDDCGDKGEQYYQRFEDEQD
jgi:hypothetical protein